MLTFTPRYRIDEEERAGQEVINELQREIDLAINRLRERRIRIETAEKIANDPYNTENLKKQLLVLLESCVDSGKYFKWRLYKLYTLRTKSVFDRITIQQCERYLENKYNEWKWLHSAYMKLIVADNSPSEITMKQFWR